MSTLPEANESEETVVAWLVREDVLGAGVTAANDLKRWAKALAWSAQRVESMRRRGAPALEVARTVFDDYYPLICLRLLDEAKERLLACRTVFEDEHYYRMLGDALAALAHLEEEFGHRDNAIQLEHDALRYKYVNENPQAIAVSHYNLANYLERAAEDPPAGLAHRLACAVIEFQINSGRLSSTLKALGRQLLQFDDTPSMLMSFTELCSLVDRIEGVHLGQLVEDLPKRAPSGQAALAEVVRLAREVSHDDLTADARGLAALTSALATLLGVDRNTSEPVAESSAARGDVTYWRPLIDQLGRVLITGEGGEDPVAGLDPAHAAIIQRLRGILTGEVLLDPKSLRARAGATALMNAPGLLPELFKRFFEILDKDLAGEIPDLAAALRPVLRDLVEEDDTDAFREVWMLANASRAREYGAVIPHTEGLASTGATAEGFFETAVTISDKIAGKAWARQAIASRAQAYRETGRYDEALTDLTRAIDLDPANFWAIGERGETYRETGRYDEALTDFTRAIDLDPAYAWAIASRGQAYLETGRYVEALADFTRAIELEPSMAWAIAGRGEIYRLMRRYDEALADLTRVLSLAPDREDIREDIRAELEDLRGRRGE